MFFYSYSSHPKTLNKTEDQNTSSPKASFVGLLYSEDVIVDGRWMCPTSIFVDFGNFLPPKKCPKKKEVIVTQEAPQQVPFEQ